MSERHAVIVGGGIGGLCAALGLHQAGWRVTVLERAPGFTDVGAGITLWPNAMRGLEALGLADRMAPLMTRQAAGALRDQHGRWLSRLRADRLERALGRPLVAIHRAELIDLLRGALPADALRPGVKVRGVSADGRVRWDGGQLRADLVVGADGVHSVVRSELWPNHPGPEYAGSTSFRALVDLPEQATLSGMLGPGVEIGMVPLVDRRLYWFAAIVAPAGTGRDDPRAFLTRRLDRWPDPVGKLIERTPAERLLHHDLVALTPLTSYVTGSVALLGDAAHAMTPFLGQGGCQAIEDAVVLAASLGTHATVDAGLREYDRVRRPRSQSIARQSARTGKAGSQLVHPVAVAVRDAAIRAAPAAALVRTIAAPVRWTPPTIN